MTRTSKQLAWNKIEVVKKIFKDMNSISNVYFLFLGIQVFISASIPLVNVVIPRMIIDDILYGRTESAIADVIIWFFINLIFGIFNRLLTCFFEVRSKIFRKQLENLLMNKVMLVEYKTIEQAQTHERKEEARRGVEHILEFIENIRNLLANIFTLICATCLISYLNVFIALLIVCVVLFNAFRNYKRIQSDIEKEQMFAILFRRWGYLNYICRDTANAKEIRFHHLSRWLSDKISHFVQSHHEIIRSGYHITSATKRQAAFSYMIQRGIVYFYVGKQLLVNKISVGEFTQYIAAVELVSTKFVDIINTLLDMSKNSYFIERYYEFIDLEDFEYIDNTSGMPDSINLSGVEIQDVWFRYSEDSDYVLKGFSLNIPLGEHLSVVGRNGSGKTTLIKLLLRLYRPEKGRILLNGKDIYDYSYIDYCKMFSVIFQDFKIFSFTVLDNILMEDMSADSKEAQLSDKVKEKVNMAVDKANLYEVIKEFPYGLYTYVNKNYVSEGYEFSGGMQQTLAMCRAYYRDANCIILDEPTAMLDPASEARVYENFNGLIGEKTAVYISHRMSSSRFCDRIAYIDEGVVKEYGTHDELMQLNGLYAIMFNTQAELFT